MTKEIEIPEGYEAKIVGNKVIIEPKDSEDKRIKEELISFLRIGQPYFCPNTNKREEWANWVERQKEQQPTGWNDDDEIWAHLILRELEKIKEDSSEYSKHYARLIDWFTYRFKSLRPQPHWKPNEKQMDALKVSSEYEPCLKNREYLKSLYSDLQKLM